MWLLLVEDEKKLAQSIKRGLEEEGHVVEMIHDGEEAELEGLVNDYDVVILDWRLPKRDGKQILTSWRKNKRIFPVLMLTALSDLEYKISGLDAGADDYMSKPFSFDELLARVRALGRRSSELNSNDKVIELGPIELDPRKHLVKICGSTLFLRPKEFTLLELLLKHPESVYSKTQIAERVWGSSYYVSDNTIEATVSTLRHKLHESFNDCEKISITNDEYIIETIRGAGYKLNSELLQQQS